MKTYKLLILVLLILPLSNSCIAQKKEIKRNEVVFDSLVSIIKTDTEIVKNMISEIEFKDDSIFTLMNDMLTLPFDTIVDKYNFNSIEEENFISSISVTAEIVKAMNKLNNGLNFDNIEYMNSENNQNLKQKRELKIDSIKSVIWSSKKVLTLDENIKKTSNGQRRLAIYHVESKQCIEVKISEDNGLSIVTHLIFRVSPAQNWKIEYYDTIEEKYTDFEEWNK